MSSRNLELTVRLERPGIAHFHDRSDPLEGKSRKPIRSGLRNVHAREHRCGSQTRPVERDRHGESLSQCRVAICVHLKKARLMELGREGQDGRSDILSDLVAEVRRPKAVPGSTTPTSCERPLAYRPTRRQRSDERQVMSSVSGSLTTASHIPADCEGGETSQTQRRLRPSDGRRRGTGSTRRPQPTRRKDREGVPRDVDTVLREVRLSVTRCSLLAELPTRRYILSPSL